MSYQVYKIVHVVGMILLFFSLGGIYLHLINGGSKKFNWRQNVGMTHGIGLFLLIFSGFGMIEGRLNRGAPLWLVFKLIIWLLLGGVIGVVYRKPQTTKKMWWATLALGGIATWLAISKPF